MLIFFVITKMILTKIAGLVVIAEKYADKN